MYPENCAYYRFKSRIHNKDNDLFLTGSKSWFMIVFIHAKERNKKHFLPCRELTPARRQIPFDLVSMFTFSMPSHSPPS